MSSAPDLSGPVRAALMASSAITSQLAAYAGSYPIFTRRPAPTDAPYPLIMISPDIAVDEEDGVNDFRPVVERDVIVYGQNDTPAHYLVVESIAYAVRDLFHRQWQVINVAGWKVVEIRARGPMPAPTDDVQTVGRLVALTISLAAPR